jgi:hypothetical protein
MPGADDVLVAARTALLDALAALGEHTDEVTIIGAQAIYLHTGAADVALAEATKDSDLVLDPRTLADDPRLEEAMTGAGFHQDLENPQPGAWLSPTGIPVDLMVPEALAGPQSCRSGRIPPHANHATRRAVGLEAAVIDRARLPIRALDPADDRDVTAYVAGPAALLIAKLHKLAERLDQPTRLLDKDAHDIYRLLVAISTDELARSLGRLLAEDLSATVTRQAVGHLAELFAAGPEAMGSQMAGRAEALVGDPATVARSVSILAADLTASLENS